MKATAQEARKRKQQTSLTSFFTKSSEQQQQQQQGQAERRYGSSTTQHQHHTAAAEKDVPTTSLLRIQPRQDDDNSHDGPLSLEEIADEDDLLLSELVTTKRTKTTINNKATTHASTKRRKSKHSSSSQRHKGLENPWKAKKTPAASAVEETNNVVNSNQSATSSSDSILHSVSANDDENDITTTASNPSSTTNNNINNNDATTIQNPPATAEPIKQSTKPTVDAILYNTSKNIVHQLNQRALLCGGGGRRTKKNPNNSSILFNHPPAFVDTSSWLFLSSHTTAGCRKVAWDYDRHPTTQARLGTLLACAYHDGWIRIFEVDTMHARDVFHKKKQQQQQCVVEALICFRTSLPALDMQWNPYCPDELAVQTQEGVQLFDLGEVKAWQDENHTGGGDHTTTTAWHTNATRVPCREFVCKVKSSTVATLLFVSDEQHILVATDDSVTCFSLYQPSTGSSSSISSNKKSVWTLPWQRVSAMTCIQNSRDLILLGSTEGSFCVINVKRLHRVSFSVTVRPTIVCEWSSYRNNNYNNNSDVNACPAATWMGIQHIFADSLELLSEKLMIGLLTWVTSGGAIMSASNIELRGDNKSPRMTVHVHHSPKMIRCINAEKEDVPLSRPMWSFPSSRCRSHCTSELAVVEKVSQITRVLPGHDQRVMSTSSMDQMIHQDNSKPQLVLQWMQGSRKTTSIELRDAPLAVAIHPQQEWIAVGSNTFGVYLLHSRKR
jgi:hypothetical protein